jgi:hypothetical protein
MYNGQAGQDQFVLNILKKKRNGYFLEIGSNHPIQINNTYILEKEYNWTGLMVEYDRQYEQLYKTIRTSHYIINDATKIDYFKIFTDLNFPKNLDYLQIDLEVHNGSTINTLELLNTTVFPDYKFATVTFEHDIYRGDYFNTRKRSREIFENNGYVRIFGDIYNPDESAQFEDWYVHPDLVDINYVNSVKEIGPIHYNAAINKLSN